MSEGVDESACEKIEASVVAEERMVLREMCW